MKLPTMLAAAGLLLYGATFTLAAGEKKPAIDESSIIIEEVADKAAPTATTPSLMGNSQSTPLDPNLILGTLDRIVNLVDKVWTLIQKNQPVTSSKVNYANAVPAGITHWTQLQGWSKPSVKRYEFSAKGLTGIKTVKVVYQVHWTHGGNYQGKGKYLTGVSVEPIKVSVPWGYSVDLSAAVPDSTVANVGTSEDPVASMQVQLTWRIATAFKVVEEKAVYYLQGDGYIQEIGTPFARGKAAKQARLTKELERKAEAIKF